MPRINIEDSIYREERYVNLCIAAGSRIMAIGALSCLWIEAQKHFLTTGEIPNEEWEKTGLPEYLITTGWAERTQTGVRAKGQNEQFSWLKQKQEAGRLGGLSRGKNEGSSAAKRTLANAKRTKASSSFSRRERKTLSSPVGDDLAMLYQIYPVRGGLDMGKKQGLARLAKLIAESKITLEGARTAIENYAAACAKNGIRGERVKMFSSFFGEGEAWREYAEMGSRKTSPEDEEEQIRKVIGY